MPLDVVVPSLPGYGFSSPLPVSGINYWRTADLWVKLMQDGLGYEKFATQEGDWGAILSAYLGHKIRGRGARCPVFRSHSAALGLDAKKPCMLKVFLQHDRRNGQ